MENENRLVCKDGTVKWISIKAQLMEDIPGEKFFYCVFVDISKQKEEELRISAVEKNLAIAIATPRWSTGSTIFPVPPLM